MITLHAIVKNEDRFIKAALVSALTSKDVKRALVWGYRVDRQYGCGNIVN